MVEGVFRVVVFVCFCSLLVWGSFPEVVLSLFLEYCCSFFWVGKVFYAVEFGLLGFWLFVLVGLIIYLILFILVLFFFSGWVSVQQYSLYWLVVVLSWGSLCSYIDVWYFLQFLVYTCFRLGVGLSVLLGFTVFGSWFFLSVFVFGGLIYWFIIYYFLVLVF